MSTVNEILERHTTELRTTVNKLNEVGLYRPATQVQSLLNNLAATRENLAEDTGETEVG